jgi:TolB-like protein/Tfp pilus assembly protein PilF
MGIARRGGGAEVRYRFADYMLDVARRELLRGGHQVALEPQVFDLLAFLVQHRHRVVSKDDLLDSVWAGRLVSESTFFTRINAARRAIGDDGERQRLIRTVPRKGFRFIGEAAEVSGEVAPVPEIEPAAPRLSIVVLPFVNIGSDPEQEYFADGITDDLTTDLSRVPGSFVIARTTALSYKGKAADVKQIGRELGVLYVVEGSVRRTGEQVQINAQLIDAATGAHIWADRFDGERWNLSELQRDVTIRIYQTLNRELVGAVNRRIELEHPTNPDARDYIMRGKAILNLRTSRENLLAARNCFERALEIDERSSDAMLNLALVMMDEDTFGWSIDRDAARVRAESLVRRALDADSNNAFGHYVMGHVLRRQGRPEDALNALQTAVNLDRNLTGALGNLGHTLNFLGRPEEAIPYIEKSLRLDPRGPFLARRLFQFGLAHMLLGRADEAINIFRRALAENPGLWVMHFGLAGALGLKGDLDEARSELAEGLRQKPEYDTLKKYVDAYPSSRNPKGWALREKTFNVGLRNAGLPEE